jgi:hypothetical protein
MPPKGYLPINNKTYNLGEPLRGALRHSRRAIRFITRTRYAVAGGSATIPLALRASCT